MKRKCKGCGCLFEPKAHVPGQEYCSKKACQNLRRQRWRKQKLLTDADYKADQYDAQKRWRENNPDYWKRYRASHPDYVEKNRQKQKERNRKQKKASNERVPEIAKRYALTPDSDLISGTYVLTPADGAMIANRYALLVNLDVVTDGYKTNIFQME